MPDERDVPGTTSAPAAAPALSSYTAVAIQTAHGSAPDRATIQRNVERVVGLIEGAVWGYAHWGYPVKLVALPEFCLQGIPYFSHEELERHDVLIRLDGPEIAALAACARRLDIHIACGTVLEADEAYPGLTFNTAVVVGPAGIVLRYRKVNPWIPIETHASPHAVAGYAEELWPVADTEIGRIGCLVCNDILFPETYRELAVRGVEVVIVANALPSPWGVEQPTPWGTIVPQVRSLENVVVTVNVNQGGALLPFVFTGGSGIFDWEGRVLAQTALDGEQLVAGHVHLTALREWRARTYQHAGPAALRSSAYDYLGRPGLPGGTVAPDGTVTSDELRRQIDAGRARLGD